MSGPGIGVYNETRRDHPCERCGATVYDITIGCSDGTGYRFCLSCVGKTLEEWVRARTTKTPQHGVVS
jgi:hypothetical protein